MLGPKEGSPQQWMIYTRRRKGEGKLGKSNEKAFGGGENHEESVWKNHEKEATSAEVVLV